MPTETIAVTASMQLMIEAMKEDLEPEAFQDWLRGIIGNIAFELRHLQQAPPGSTRATIIRMRIDKAISVFFTNHPYNKSLVTCFHCTSSGCCHTQVDITIDEARLLAGLVQAGHPIDAERLKKQAAVADTEQADTVEKPTVHIVNPTPCEIEKGHVHFIEEMEKISYQADSVAHAICIVALKAVGVPI